MFVAFWFQEDKKNYILIYLYYLFHDLLSTYYIIDVHHLFLGILHMISTVPLQYFDDIPVEWHCGEKVSYKTSTRPTALPDNKNNKIIAITEHKELNEELERNSLVVVVMCLGFFREWASLLSYVTYPTRLCDVC